MARVTRRLRIRGRVQGVFYRGWTVETARGLGLAGWVRNRSDGSVEILVEGEEEAVARLVERCRVGPPGARVEGIDVEESAGEAPHPFGQKPTA